MARHPRKQIAERDRTPAPTLAALREELSSLANPAHAISSLRFFKTAPGEYGAGDKFLGLKVPTLRLLERKYARLADADALALLASPWHEERLLALMLLVNGYDRGDSSRRDRINRAYLEHTRYVNNWDLVDTSAAHIVGAHLEPGKISLLERLARSADIWERRIAIIATYHFIRQNEFGPTLKVARILLEDTHDLIHKAVGWMLREVGNRDRTTEDAFLRKHYRTMPRTMLRYAIERHPPRVRKQYLAGTL